MGGNAVGVPFPILYPSHGESAFYLFELYPELKTHGKILSPVSPLGNFIILFTVIGLILHVRKVFMKRRGKLTNHSSRRHKDGAS